METEKQQHEKPQHDARSSQTPSMLAKVNPFRGLLRSKLIWLALLMTVGGGASIAYQALTKEGSAAASGASLWTFRIGISFLAAFIFAFLIKRAIKWALLIVAVLVAGAWALNKLGIGITKDHMSALESQGKDAIEWVQTTADSTWKSIARYLPSAASAGFGLFRGARQPGPPPVA